MKKLFLLLATAAATTGMLQAQNPVIRNQFSADPTARVFNGKVYIYPSHDIPSPVKHLKEMVLHGRLSCIYLDQLDPLD